MLLLQWERPNMMPFNFALEANNLGRIVTSQDFIKFWGNFFFAFVMSALIENP
jgi:hypothetical protein